MGIWQRGLFRSTKDVSYTESDGVRDIRTAIAQWHRSDLSMAELEERLKRIVRNVKAGQTAAERERQATDPAVGPFGSHILTSQQGSEPEEQVRIVDTTPRDEAGRDLAVTCKHLAERMDELTERFMNYQLAVNNQLHDNHAMARQTEISLERLDADHTRRLKKLEATTASGEKLLDLETSVEVNRVALDKTIANVEQLQQDQSRGSAQMARFWSVLRGNARQDDQEADAIFRRLMDFAGEFGGYLRALEGMDKHGPDRGTSLCREDRFGRES